VEAPRRTRVEQKGTAAPFEQLYRDYALLERGHDYVRAANVGELYEKEMVK
jgi:hypothetical protein